MADAMVFALGPPHAAFASSCAARARIARPRSRSIGARRRIHSAASLVYRASAPDQTSLRSVRAYPPSRMRAVAGGRGRPGGRVAAIGLEALLATRRRGRLFTDRDSDDERPAARDRAVSRAGGRARRGGVVLGVAWSACRPRSRSARAWRCQGLWCTRSRAHDPGGARDCAHRASNFALYSRLLGGGRAEIGRIATGVIALSALIALAGMPSYPCRSARGVRF